MREEIFTNPAIVSESNPMTLNGTIAKSGILLAANVAAALGGWMSIQANPGNTLLIFGSGILAFVLAIAAVFLPRLAMPLGLSYAGLAGFFLGGISWIYAQQFKGTTWSGIVPMAVAATFTVFGVMLLLYLARIIRVTETFRTVVVAATAAIMVFYVGSFVVGMFWGGVWNLPVFGSGPIGIVFSVLVVGLAAFNLALDFDNIERGVANRLPKYMEWYCGFGLLVTLVWLYLEILRLLSKVANAGR